jgi:hypothetical protein
MKPLIIYHGDCNDGFGAALAAYLKYGDEAEYISGMYDGAVPNVVNRDVLIFDYHFKKVVLEKMKLEANTLLLKDHHATVAASLKDLPYAYFDMKKSGAVLAWEHFFNEPVPEMFLWLQDRDLWENKFPETLPFYFYLNSHPYDLKAWKDVFEKLKNPEDRKKILDIGTQIQNFYYIQLELLLKHHARLITIDGMNGWILNTNRLFATEAGSILAKRTGTFALIWSVNEKNEIGCSVRSVDGSAIKIAESRGGGGHIDAAKFRMKVEEFTTQFLIN